MKKEELELEMQRWAESQYEKIRFFEKKMMEINKNIDDHSDKMNVCLFDDVIFILESILESY